jgi:hypothetical protein
MIEHLYFTWFGINDKSGGLPIGEQVILVGIRKLEGLVPNSGKKITNFLNPTYITVHIFAEQNVLPGFHNLIANEFQPCGFDMTLTSLPGETEEEGGDQRAEQIADVIHYCGG